MPILSVITSSPMAPLIGILELINQFSAIRLRIRADLIPPASPRTHPPRTGNRVVGADRIRKRWAASIRIDPHFMPQAVIDFLEIIQIQEQFWQPYGSCCCAF